PLGKSPFAAPLQVDMGVHKIRVTKPGFLDFATAPELPGGQPFHIFATMVPERHEGGLRVLAGPAEVIQIVRGESSGGSLERTLLGLLCAGVLAASCGSDEAKPRGQLMLAITTDLAIDKDMNQVHVEVTDQNGLVVDSSDRDIIPTGEDALPGTLALVPPNAG